jgi:adenylate kinase family enzyme
MKVVYMFGPQGCGKGEISRRLQKALIGAGISTELLVMSDLLRDETIVTGADDRALITRKMTAGENVTREIAIHCGIVGETRCLQNNPEVIIKDGFLREFPQTEAFLQRELSMGHEIHVFSMSAENEICIYRMLHRAKEDETRAEPATTEQCKKRLRVFASSSYQIITAVSKTRGARIRFIDANPHRPEEVLLNTIIGSDWLRETL